MRGADGQCESRGRDKRATLGDIKTTRRGKKSSSLLHDDDWQAPLGKEQENPLETYR